MEYRAALLQAISQWSLDPIPDEWLFEKFREKVIRAMSASEAFEAINETVDILLYETDESNSIEILVSIQALARQSDTTELPNSLQINKDKIQSKFAQYSDYAQNQLQSLFRHYRI